MRKVTLENYLAWKKTPAQLSKLLSDASAEHWARKVLGNPHLILQGICQNRKDFIK